MPTTHHSTHWSVDRVRSTFIDFFAKKHAHVFVPSSPVVPHDDPTLLFTNAGMNQFKPIFLGQVDPKSDLAKLKRAVNSQKCIRAGGKHNDLDDVGKDTYHHTFFEMLGNWSFGGYFKKEAVEWSWDLLTRVYGLPPAALYASYFGGSPEAGLEPDLETKALWERYLPTERVIPGNMKDNFWEMGETGPCGPCTEIHVDRLTAMGLEKRVVSEKVNAGDPDVIEIWNNVFIQFNREADRSLRPLPARHVDTGMGLERITSILQNQRSNYDTDVFFPIFAEIERLSGARAYTGKLGTEDTDNIDTAYRVIADHIRTLTFAITDGATPSNEGRGYVLRRILRRAVRYGRQMLSARGGFFCQLVPVVVRTFGDAFPELKKNPARVEGIIRDEEESFGKTLDRGIKLFEDAYASAIRAGATNVASISAHDTFQLYDTYGFPPDLTQQMAEERGLKVDLEGFERLMQEQRTRARAAGKSGGGAPGAAGVTLGGEQTAQLTKLGVQPTDDSYKFAAKDISARVEAIWNGENFDQRIGTGTMPLDHLIGIVLSRTNFYSEMGGQEPDAGRLHTISSHRPDAGQGGGSEPGEFRVESVQSFGGFVLHIGRMTRGEIRVGEDLHLTVDRQRRGAIASNHTATHLLNVAMRDALGEGVDQKGSLVTPDRLRFDFTFNRPVTPDEIRAIEKGVRERIGAGLTVYAETAPLAQARAINGLRAVFGEKYPDPVRVVSIGVPLSDLVADPASEFWHDVSVEFCGGTHVASTHEIGNFALTSEEGIAKGIRRFTALSGVPALAAIKAADAVADRLREADKLSGDALASETQQISAEIDQFTLPAARKHELRSTLSLLQDRVKQAQKESGAAKSQEASKKARQIAESASVSLAEIIINTIDIGSDRKALQSAVSTIQSICPRSAVMLFSPDESDGKITIMAAVPPSVVKRGLSAGEWVRVAAEACGGKGGGKPDAAQGGGSDISKLKAAIDVATSFAHQKLGA